MLSCQPCFVYLVIVVMAVEEGLLPEDHACQHTAQAPHVKTVVIHLKHTVKVSKGAQTGWEHNNLNMKS